MSFQHAPRCEAKKAPPPAPAPQRPRGLESESEPTRVSVCPSADMHTTGLVSVSDPVPVSEVATKPVPASAPQHKLTYGPLCPSELVLHDTSERAPPPVPSEPMAEARMENTASEAAVIVESALPEPTGLGPPTGGLALALRRRDVGVGLCNAPSLPLNSTK